MGRLQELSGHFPLSRKQKGKKNMVFNLLKLRWPKKEIAKKKTQTKSRKIKCRKTRPTTSSERKVNDNSSDQHSTKKTKVDNVLKSNDEDENTEREEEGVMHDFDHHDTINAESYEKYFENICKLLSYYY